jgi:two-component system CheB/CheR fusion protein
MGKWFMMRIMPYRTLNNVIEGAVITFVDITEIVDAQEMRHFAVVIHDAYDAITVQDMDGNILAWNPSATRLYGWSEAEAQKMNVKDRIPDANKEKALKTILDLSQNKILKPYHTQRLCKDGSIKEVWITATILLNDNGENYAIATTERLNND